ncbi:uncharacterized protein A4U43_C06F5970 [Asparagus officinalis]|uniref:BHLH domain-containing protein n=1 Tax=Asparagus officinalis TaxID=4686 RepID=A0A5P1EQG5_ASPOF|nr:uncharacterized protein A4U43_C06F5970 [Asparagus officinalis]
MATPQESFATSDHDLPPCLHLHYGENCHHADALSQYDHLDHAIDYIKKLSERIERLKQRKNSVTGEASDKESDGGMAGELGLPVVEVRHQDSIVEVVLITSLKTSFVFHETIKVLEEEGIDVLNAGFSVVRDKIFYTIHSQVVSSINDFEASKVSERLKKLI